MEPLSFENIEIKIGSLVTPATHLMLSNDEIKLSTVYSIDDYMIQLNGSKLWVYACDYCVCAEPNYNRDGSVVIYEDWKNFETWYVNFNLICIDGFEDWFDQYFEDVYELSDFLYGDASQVVLRHKSKHKDSDIDIYTKDFLSKVDWLEIAEYNTHLVVDRDNDEDYKDGYSEGYSDADPGL